MELQMLWLCSGRLTLADNAKLGEGVVLHTCAQRPLSAGAVSVGNINGTCRVRWVRI